MKQNLNIRARAIKLLRENPGTNLYDLVFGNSFLEVTPNTQVTKGKSWISKQ